MEKIYWIGTSSEQLKRLMTGLTYRRNPICRETGDLKIGDLVAYRGIRSAFNLANDIVGKNMGELPLIACLVFPESQPGEIIIPANAKVFPIKADPLATLIDHYKNPGEETYALRSFREALLPNLLLDSAEKWMDQTIEMLFFAAARIALGSDPDWESITRHGLATRENDQHWLVRDKSTGRFVKPLPPIFLCSMVRDRRTVDHLCNALVVRAMQQGEVISLPVNGSIATSEDEDKPRIDFIFSVEASWNRTRLENGVSVSTTQYQLGIHFGSAGVNFLNAWKKEFGEISNIVWVDRRYAKVTANIANNRRKK